MRMKIWGRRLVVSVLVMISLGRLFAVSSYDRFEVPWFDRQCMYPYDATLSTISDITQYLAFATPVVFAFAAPSSEYPKIGLSYGGAAVAAYGTKAVIKHFVKRPRPYLYFDASYPDEDDALRSFPSGHTTMAFVGAAYTQSAFSLWYPDSPYRVPTTIAAWSLAAATAVLRVASGNHFVTDVLAGAAIGTLLGYASPYIASLFAPDDQAPSLFVSPNVVAVAVSF